MIDEGTGGCYYGGADNDGDDGSQYLNLSGGDDGGENSGDDGADHGGDHGEDTLITKSDEVYKSSTDQSLVQMH